jgi:hypothetical protein
MTIASVSSVSAAPPAASAPPPASQSAPSQASTKASKDRHEVGHHKPEATATSAATASSATQSGLSVLQLGG